MLTLSEIIVHYGQVPVLKGISLQVEEGRIVSLIGANGAGKTTLLRTISGLIAPTRGIVVFEGQPIHQKPPHEIVGLGIVLVPEGKGLFTSLTVEDNLKIGSYLPRVRRDRSKTMERVFQMFPRLKERRDQPSRTLSGGEQQMLAMGRGLMAKPKLLMLDEPSLGLAPKMVTHIFSIIRKINQERTTILLVEQNVVHSLRMSQQGFVIENGKIVLSGTGEELLRDQHTREAYFGTFRSKENA
jgi:branched-chain amino acid transport system ATP-binding protein